MTAAGIIGLLTLILTLFLRFLPSKEEASAAKERDEIGKIRDGEKKFEETGDTSDLGDLY